MSVPVRLVEVMGNRIIDLHSRDKPVAELLSQKLYRIEVSDGDMVYIHYVILP